jgi:hypothetical protein
LSNLFEMVLEHHGQLLAIVQHTAGRKVTDDAPDLS